MPSVDVVDETFLAVPPNVVAAAFAAPSSWRTYWPDLELDVYADRGNEGLRWTVRGALIGTMEVWLEPVLDGTVLHYFLRADPARDDRTRSQEWTPRRVQREVRNRQIAAKSVALQLKTTLEDGRPAGCPPAG